MIRDEATKYLIDISYKFGNISVEYLTEKDGEKMREAINVLTNEQQTCEDVISRREAIKMFKYNYKGERIPDYDCDNFPVQIAVKTVKEILRDLPPVNPQPKWIPVSERLPEDSELVLFSTKTDRVFEGRFFADNTDRQWYAFRDETFAWNNVVTAWMPLPKPYELQESEVSE